MLPGGSLIPIDVYRDGDVQRSGNHPQAFGKLRRDAPLEAATHFQVMPLGGSLILIAFYQDGDGWLGTYPMVL